jgi:D-sedoheptulose 7-phosphate isomerase
MKVIALTGKDGGKIRDICDIEISVQHMGYSDRIQEIHIKIIHSMIDFMSKAL